MKTSHILGLIALVVLVPALSGQTCTVHVQLKFYWLAENPLPQVVTRAVADAQEARTLFKLTYGQIGEANWIETAKGKYSGICLEKDHPDYYVLWTWVPWVPGSDRTVVSVLSSRSPGCVIGPTPFFQTDQTGKDLEHANKRAFKETLQFLSKATKQPPSPEASCVSLDSLISAVESSHSANESETAHEKPTTEPGKGSAPPAEVQQAGLDISSTPPGADIELDGSFAGNTPSAIVVPIGEHTLRITKNGYKSWQRKINAHAGKTSIAAELEKETQPPR